MQRNVEQKRVEVRYLDKVASAAAPPACTAGRSCDCSPQTSAYRLCSSGTAWCKPRLRAATCTRRLAGPCRGPATALIPQSHAQQATHNTHHCMPARPRTCAAGRRQPTLQASRGRIPAGKSWADEWLKQYTVPHSSQHIFGFFGSPFARRTQAEALQKTGPPQQQTDRP